MADALINLLQSRTVLIQAGKAVGTGTLIAPGMVLTCAHVIRHVKDQLETITVSLPDLTEPGKSLWEEHPSKVYMSNKYEEPYEVPSNADIETLNWYKKEYPDVAVLQIDREDHDIIKFSKYKEPSFDLKDKQFLAFGFQNADKELKRNSPEGVSLIYSGEQVDGIIRKLVFVQGQIRPGMSGAGLIERESGQLIGIVHKTKSPNDDLGAYVIPAETIWRVIQKWHNDELNELFASLQSKDLEVKVKKQYLRDYPQFSMLRKHRVKLILFLVLIFFTLFWGLYHKGLTTGSGITSIIFVSIGLFSALLGGWLGQNVNEETGKLRDKVGKILLGKAGTLTLIVWLMGLIYIWTYRSSVWINGYSEKEKINILVKHGKDFKEIDTITLNPSGKTDALLLASLPFGEKVKITTEGRKDNDLILKSFNRIELFYPSDFSEEPVALIRIPANYLARMKRYKVVYKKNNGNWNTIDSLKSQKGILNGSLLLGLRDIDIENDMIVEWQKYLNEQGLSNDMRDSIIKKWKEVKPIRIDLNLNDTLRIKLISKEILKSNVDLDTIIGVAAKTIIVGEKDKNGYYKLDIND